MAFFDKIAAAAKSAKESANTAIEVGKLNLKIKSENDAIEQFKCQIGDLLWAQYQEGEVTDPRIIALCESIAAANANIEALQQQIAELKAPAAPAEAEDAEEEAPQPVLERHCTQCGAVVDEESKFCSKCGAQL
jgi:cell division protein FtsL